MKDALDVVMAWQLRNPESTDTEAAIRAVRASREQQTDSELPSRLASHFLQLTIPPFFPQNKSVTNALEASRQPAPWKDPGAEYVLELLMWSIAALSRKEKEAKWHLLVPPILKMMDDMDAAWKARGCRILGLLLESLRQSSSGLSAMSKGTDRQKAMDFLERTGYHNVFSEALLPMFTYIPSLTPEPEAVPLFKQLLPALTTLALLLPTESSGGDTRDGLLDKIIRQGAFAPLAHFPTPAAYPELATVVVSHLQVLLGHMGIDSVKHLRHVIPLLSKMLQEPFVVSHKALSLSTLKTMQAVILNAWPRLEGYRGAVMMGLCVCWGRCLDETSLDLEHVGEVKSELQETVAMLDAVMQASDNASVRDKWEDEKAELVEVWPACKSLLDDCASGSVESSVS
jgi:tRNA nucleotidyltransferase (CCA-adding enzyme)